MFFRLTIVCVCLTALLALNSVNAKSVGGLQSQQPTLRDIKVVSNIREFAKSHPGLKLTRMTKEPSKARDQSVRYSLGGRVSGDRLVAQGADVYAYPAKKDVTIQLTYPESGTGSIVTYVEILCLQDTTDGNAYVVAGGIGQRFISIVVEANQTENFSYSAQFYGTD